MGRMQCKGKGKGISSTTLPFKRKAPKWVTMTPSAVTELIVKMAKKGLMPSQIGIILRDHHGIPQVNFLTGCKILRLLKKNGSFWFNKGCGPEIPEDLYCMIKKAVSMRKHLEKNRKDTDAKYRLILIEAKIHRLARYYRKKSQLAPNWK